MSAHVLEFSEVTTLPPLVDVESTALLSLLERRRSIRRLRSGPFSVETRGRLLNAIRLTPAAFNLPPWRVVLIHEQREAFWEVVEAGFRDALEGERLRRYLDRVDGFRAGVAVALIYEDRAVHVQLRDAWQISDEQARS